MTHLLRTSLLLAASATVLTACGPPPSDVEGRYSESAPSRSSRSMGESRSDRDLGIPSRAEERSPTASMGAGPAPAAAPQRNPLAGLPGAAAASTVPSSPVEDARITARVRASLAADRELQQQAQRIDVDTHDGVVTLSGAVPSMALKARAGEVARLVHNVQAVNDQLTVVSG